MQRVFRIVDTADLTPMSLKPTERMVQSVRLHGVIAPVLLQERVDDDGVIGLEIVDGNRRVSAAKKVGLRQIPAIVYQDADPEAMSAATVITNTLRSKNLISEWQALEKLGGTGRDVKEIGALTGLTASSYQTRMRPGALPAALREALEADKISPSVAEAAGRLPADAQRELARLYEENGRVGTADVDRLRRQMQPRDDVDVPDMPSKPGTREQLHDHMVELARFARSVGMSEYDWSRLTTAAWSQGGADDTTEIRREREPDRDDTELE